MRTSNKSLFVLFGGVLCFLALAIGSWFFYSKIDTESNLIIDASSQIALVQEKEREFDESNANLKKYADGIEKLKKTFLNESTFVSFLQTIESLAKKTGVEFKAINAALPTASTDSAIFSFQIKGSESQLVDFFMLLDKVPYSGIVINMNWVRQGKIDNLIVVKADYQIFNYTK